MDPNISVIMRFQCIIYITLHVNAWNCLKLFLILLNKHLIANIDDWPRASCTSVGPCCDFVPFSCHKFDCTLIGCRTSICHKFDCTLIGCRTYTTSLTARSLVAVLIPQVWLHAHWLPYFNMPQVWLHAHWLSYLYHKFDCTLVGCRTYTTSLTARSLIVVLIPQVWLHAHWLLYFNMPQVWLHTHWFDCMIALPSTILLRGIMEMCSIHMGRLVLTCIGIQTHMQTFFHIFRNVFAFTDICSHVINISRELPSSHCVLCVQHMYIQIAYVCIQTLMNVEDCVCVYSDSHGMQTYSLAYNTIQYNTM